MSTGPHRRALVLGASGFLGHWVSAALRSAGYEVMGVGRRASLPAVTNYRSVDSLTPTVVASVLDAFNPSHVVFLWGPGSVAQSVDAPERDFECQVPPLVSVLGGLRLKHPNTRLLIVSSAAVYGQPSVLPISEDAPTNPLSPYGFHKLIQETIGREYSEVFKIPLCIARVFSVFGPGQRKLAIWDSAQRALSGDFSVRGTGAETRDYLYVGDAAAALALLLESAAFEGEHVNVASGISVSMSDLMSTLFRLLEVRGSPRFDGRPMAASPSKWSADVARLRSMGFLPMTVLEDGLRETVEWIRQQ